MARGAVNWRLATYVAAVFGAVVWAVLSVVGLYGPDDPPGGVWMPAVATSVLLLVAGSVLTWMTRSVVARSCGVALCAAALIGWAAMASNRLVSAWMGW